ncbi:hypothetical protein ACO0K9_27320 [Undibacterium sp. Ji50W]|uniref:hypothetical protein n=1 Tax=Undibacterium sp. Ji50W TaxID=3413041 RepID=UPI003BF2F86E
MPINATEKSSAKIIPDNESGTLVWVPLEFERALSKQARHHTGSNDSVIDTHDKNLLCNFW